MVSRTRLWLSLLLLAPLLPLHAAKYTGLWLKVSDETAPAGSVVQVRLTLTEPKPIIRTRLDMEFDEFLVGDILSVSVFSPNGEATGTAVRFGNFIRIEVSSPTGDLGMGEELPLVAIAFRIRENAPPGASALFKVRDDSVFWKAEDHIWKVEDNAPGLVRVGGDLSIDDIWPSGGLVEPGQTVRIRGRGFQPSSVVEVEGAPFTSATVSSANEIVLNSSEPFVLDQRRIRIVNSTESETSFFPMLRGREGAPSAYDLLAAVTPLFAPVALDRGSVRISESPETSGTFAGLALQNPGTDPATVYIQALSPAGNVLGAVTLDLPRQQRIVRHLAELMSGIDSVSGITLRVEASSPIQILGLEGNLNEGRIQPITAY